MLSLVIPFYDDSGCPIPFVTELKKELKDIDYELILVDDCSSDSTPKELESLKDKNVHVKIEGGNIFQINFPFQAGYIAKFEKASILYTSINGDIIQIADDDNIKKVPAGDASAGYHNEIAYFAQCLKNNTQPAECMPSSSLQSIQLCYKHL